MRRKGITKNMKVNLIKRGTITHVGFKAIDMGTVGIYSLCSQRMDCSDVVSIGEDTKVTCKRCLKKMVKADEYGRVIL